MDLVTISTIENLSDLVFVGDSTSPPCVPILDLRSPKFFTRLTPVELANGQNLG